MEFYIIYTLSLDVIEDISKTKLERRSLAADKSRAAANFDLKEQVTWDRIRSVPPLREFDVLKTVNPLSNLINKKTQVSSSCE